jgi:hypothetical protein
MSMKETILKQGKRLADTQTMPTYKYEETIEGMTLRDHFAGLAMQGLLIKGHTDIPSIVENSWKVAGAMLAERGKEKPYNAPDLHGRRDE